MTVKTETRTLTVSPELRAADDGGRKIVGYAAVFNSTTDIAGIFRERIMPGAFTKAIRGDVRALFDHDSSKVLGRTTAGTLRLREDERGLAVEIDPPDTQVARDLIVSIDRGDIDGMSFRFTAVRQEWDDSAEPPLRTIYEMELDEVSVVTFPQYDDTTVGLRSLDEARKERRQHNFSAAARRLRMKATLDLRARSKA